MAVYKIFPDKDAFIFTEVPIANAGYDEMLEIGSYPMSGIGQTIRTLIHFPTSTIQTVVDSKIGNTNFSASLNISLASAYELPTSHSILALPVYQYWDGGVGKYGDYPYDKSGCTWRYSKLGNASSWELPYNSLNVPTNVTGSHNDNYPGGGNWYTGSNGINLIASESFEINDDLDLGINVTEAVKLHYDGTIDNNGFIVKFEDSVEFETTSSIRLKYYSRETNTIYPPTLDIKWDDSVYLPGSLPTLTSDEVHISISNNKGKYIDEGKQRFRVHARPLYPVRTFTTGSIYKTNYALPQNSYWGVRDEFTEEMIIPFDTEFTKISCDSTGPFFDVYMDGLQPERYYRVLVKTELDGTTTVYDNENTFKVVRNG